MTQTSLQRAHAGKKAGLKRPKLRVKKGDKVIVTTGRDRGKIGEIVEVNPRENRVKVRGINLVKRHTKASASGSGGIVQKEAPIHVSNVAHVDPKSGIATRISFKILDDGSKVRVAKRSGIEIDR